MCSTIRSASRCVPPNVLLVVSGGEVSESERVGLRRSGRLHQRGERHAFPEPPEPDPPVRHRPHAAHEDGKPVTHSYLLTEGL